MFRLKKVTEKMKCLISKTYYCEKCGFCSKNIIKICPQCNELLKIEGVVEVNER